MSDNFGSDRRKSKRINKNFILSYFDLNDPLNRRNASQLKNISAGGVCITTSRPLSAGTRLEVEFKSPLANETIHVQGVVLESREKIKNIIYDTRLKFDKVSPQAQIILQKLIEHFRHEESK